APSPLGQLQCVRLPEAFRGHDLQTNPRRLRFDCAPGREKPPRENVLLNEIGFQAVALEMRLADGYRLNDCSAANSQRTGERPKICRPMLFAYRFDHLDRRDPVELASDVAIIQQPKIGSSIEFLRSGAR